MDCLAQTRIGLIALMAMVAPAMSFPLAAHAQQRQEVRIHSEAARYRPSPQATSAHSDVRHRLERPHQNRTPSWSGTLNRRGQQRILYAFDLASRGAVHSAQQELLKVLSTVAQALDTEQQTRLHSEALISAHVALDEAEDFVKAGQLGARNRSITSMTAAHQTTILHGADPRRITPVIALQQYYSYAGQQFATAAGRQRVAAEALFGLGRITSLQQHHPLETDVNTTSMSEQKMLVYYQAAWAVDPQHYRAANELGVLLAQFGQWKQARKAFEYSVAHAPEVQNWRNLAVTYERLGEQKLAQLAWRRCHAAEQEGAIQASKTSSSGRVAPAVEWVDLDSFTQSGTPAGWNSQASSELSSNNQRKPRTVATPRAEEQKPSGLLSNNPFQRLKSAFNRNRSDNE